ncbi:hypothetical protein Pelo_11270 [Pelomyxa schiedti]|nr:hypothetical protein Pelo_11270 [Pelomyxa schiedti]
MPGLGIAQIHLLILPPNTSHILQPLDLAPNGVLKQKLRAFYKPKRDEGTALHRIQMLLACTRGLEYAFVPDLIKVAWARTGLWPINKEAPLRSNSVIDPIEEAIAQRETSRGPPIFGTVVIPANQPTQLWAEQEQVSRKGVHQFWKEKLTTLCTVTSGVILNKLVPNQNKELTQQQAGCFVVKLPEIQNEIQTTSLLCTALGMSSLSNIPPSPHSSPLVTGGIFQLAAGAPQLANIGFHNVYF